MTVKILNLHNVAIRKHKHIIDPKIYILVLDETVIGSDKIFQVFRVIMLYINLVDIDFNLIVNYFNVIRNLSDIYIGASFPSSTS